MKHLKITLILIFLCSLSNLFGQKKLKFGERLIYGSSLTYILHNEAAFPDFNFHEFTWSNNIAVNVTPSLYFGLGFKYIYTNGAFYPNPPTKQRYNMTTAFFQYDFFPKEKMRLFPEIVWAYGNYCFCGIKNPKKIEGSHYLGAGLGFDYPITNRLSIDLSMMFYDIINKTTQEKGEYNIYILGLNFDIINPKKQKKSL
jgi:hypothetical protein